MKAKFMILIRRGKRGGTGGDIAHVYVKEKAYFEEQVKLTEATNPDDKWFTHWREVEVPAEGHITDQVEAARLEGYRIAGVDNYGVPCHG